MLNTTCLKQYSNEEAEILSKPLLRFGAVSHSSPVNADNSAKLDGELAKLDDITQAAKGNCDIHGMLGICIYISS